LPFINAVGTFKERLNVGAALTSTVLYALAFFIYLLVTKALLSSLKSDTALIALLVVLLLIIFVPLRLAQKAFFREELNRAGVHFWILFFLTIALFVNPIVALFGGVFLMLLSAFHRVGLLSKTLRIVSIVLLVFWVVLIATKPFGSFANYLSALLPHSSAVGVLKLSLAAFVGGGLVSLVFVPRERN
ncbi:MAG TPA: hypothetical protein PLY93_06910, partial [Turneriella sp.]|nr:hypothetical protein [Turneriella sp.]